MTGDDFLNFEEEEHSHLISECEESYNNGTLEEKVFSEEEFEFLINHFVNEIDDEIVYILTSMGYEQHPYSSDLLVRYADVLIVNGEIERASEILTNQIALEPSNSDLYFLMARLNIKKGLTNLADSFLDQALSLTGEDGYVEMLLTAAQDFIDYTDYERAIFTLKKAEINEPENPELINDLAFSYERSGDFKQSMFYYQKYLDKDPFNDNVWFNVGTIYARQLDMDKALNAFDYALALNPDNSSVLFNKAILLINSNQIESGIESFKEFLKLEPGNVVALSGMAEAYLSRGLLEDAETLYTEILFYEPDNIDAMANLSNIYMGRNDFYSSKIYLRNIVGKEDTDYSLLSDNLLLSYKMSKDPEFLVNYIVSLYYLRNAELLYIYLGMLLEVDEIWLVKLYELIPSLKKDKVVNKHLNKIRKNSH